MAEKKVRDKSVDFAKGIAMIAVSFGHIMPLLYGSLDTISKLCYSFELAVFFIVSGYLQFGRTEREPVDFIKHSAVSLLYPYAMCTLLLFSIDSALDLLTDGLCLFLQGIPTKICSLVTWGAGACWLFPTFFISGCIAYFCRGDSKTSSIVKTAILIVAGSAMCIITERLGDYKDVTEKSITTASFWLWHLFSLISRSTAGASLMMIGYELKKFTTNRAGKLSGGGYYLRCFANNGRAGGISEL